MNIQEDFVSFEIAKLLKEKGFDSDEVGCFGGFYSESCYESGHGITTQSGQEVGIIYGDLTNSDLEYGDYLRPTLQMALKWLREKNLFVEIYIPSDIEHEDTIYHDTWSFDIFNLKTKGYMYCTYGEVEYNSYEEACEAAIKYCLETLI